MLIILFIEFFYKELIGYYAAFLTTVVFFPQAIRSWRMRDLSGISLVIYSLFIIGVGLWLVYGPILEKWPLILANSLTFALALSILILKIAIPTVRQNNSPIEDKEKAD